MDISLIDGNLRVNSDILKKISYFEALLRFPSSKNTNEIEFEVDCKKSVFQNLVQFVQGKYIQLKAEEISELYNLSTYFAYFELPKAIAIECYKYFFLTKDYPSLVPWLKEFLSHPDFHEMENSFSDVHQCLIVNAPPGFRIRRLEPIQIPKDFQILSQKSRYIPENPKPTLPQYYNILTENGGYRGKKLHSYYSRACFAGSDIREALQYFNFQHGNSQSRTGSQKTISCRLILDISIEEKRWVSMSGFWLASIEQRNPNVKVNWHSGNSWDFHLDGGNAGENAFTITGLPKDILNFFKNESYNYSKVSLRVHVGHFNQVFHCFPSFGYDTQSNSIFFIRSAQEIKKVLKILITDESNIVKNLCTRMVFLTYYPQPENFPI